MTLNKTVRAEKHIINPFYAKLRPQNKDKNNVLDYYKQEQKLWF